MQLFHGGAVNQGNHWVEGSIAPSAIPPKGVQISRYRGNGGPFQTPREITPQQIHAVIESFAQAAQRAIEAGFDGVEIHGANGYLPDQFLTTYTNQRRDHYNGDVRQRLRFHLELLRAVREAIPGRLLGVRMSQTKVNDLEYNWPGQLEDARVIFSEIAQTGVDFIHVAAHQGVTPVFGSSQSLSGLAKTFSGLPVITNGKLQDPALADQALADGEGDLVSIGKGALADADWATKVQNGVPPIQFHPDMITPYATLDNHEQWMATHGS
jgi:2,4-dienoyl-CoA reductase-like NADH-dependent reductase (Old Yellow Enzyme family)